MSLLTRLRNVRPEARARPDEPTLPDAGIDASLLVDLERRFGDVSTLDNDKMEAMLGATARERGNRG